MPRAMESIATINSLIRTLLAVLVAGAIGVGSCFGYSTYNQNELAFQAQNKQLEEAQLQLAGAQASLETAEAELASSRQEIAALKVEVEEQARQIEQLDTSLRLLKVNHRIARLSVIGQQTDTETGQIFSDIEFVELDEDEKPLSEPKRFRIEGDVIYIDNWIVKFDDKYVEQADIDRSTSLVLFRRIYGEFQEPREGFPLDEIGSRPPAYGRTAMSEFEKRIWDDFWNIANDEEQAQKLGIRAAHGDAPFIKVKKGKSYKVQLRASDGLSIIPENRPVQPSAPSAPSA
jgi:cell division protein FtsB